MHFGRLYNVSRTNVILSTVMVYDLKFKGNLICLALLNCVHNFVPKTFIW